VTYSYNLQFVRTEVYTVLRRCISLRYLEVTLVKHQHYRQRNFIFIISFDEGAHIRFTIMSSFDILR
jgi:hypothetical protein